VEGDGIIENSISLVDSALFADRRRRKKSREMSNAKEYRFFRSFSTKIENWSSRKAETLWGKMREKKIAGRVERKRY
jgi:hypothetical protein